MCRHLNDSRQPAKNANAIVVIPDDNYVHYARINWLENKMCCHLDDSYRLPDNYVQINWLEHKACAGNDSHYARREIRPNNLLCLVNDDINYAAVYCRWLGNKTNLTDDSCHPLSKYTHCIDNVYNTVHRVKSLLLTLAENIGLQFSIEVLTCAACLVGQAAVENNTNAASRINSGRNCKQVRTDLYQLSGDCDAVFIYGHIGHKYEPARALTLVPKDSIELIACFSGDRRLHDQRTNQYLTANFDRTSELEENRQSLVDWRTGQKPSRRAGYVITAIRDSPGLIGGRLEPQRGRSPTVKAVCGGTLGWKDPPFNSKLALPGATHQDPTQNDIINDLNSHKININYHKINLNMTEINMILISYKSNDTLNTILNHELLSSEHNKGQATLPYFLAQE